jgi:hypothetical protein
MFVEDIFACREILDTIAFPVVVKPIRSAGELESLLLIPVLS